MMKFNLTLFGGRGAGSDLAMSFPTPGGQGGNRPEGLDAQPGMEATTADALGERGRPMATTAAVQGANPLHDLGPEYQYNCQRCVTATEARFRGYDVEALPTYDGDTMDRGTNYLSNYVDPQTSTIRHTTASANRNDVERQMAAMGDGSRAIMGFAWSGAGGSGHVVNVVQRNGKTHFYDGQNGTEVSASHLFNSISRSYNIELTRVDNLAFSDTANAAVRPRRR